MSKTIVSVERFLKSCSQYSVVWVVITTYSDGTVEESLDVELYNTGE